MDENNILIKDVLYRYLNKHREQAQNGRFTLEYLSYTLHCCIKSITVSIKALENDSLIQVERRHAKVNRYTIVI